MKSEPLLGGYRVLDLTDEKGLLCGKILADLGAEVIKVERPGGDPARLEGPFYRDEIDPRKSLTWFAYNRGKKAITLDITSPRGRVLFDKLVRRADAIIESSAPGYMDSLGIGYEATRKINPSVIYTSITSFGKDGPYSSYKGTDLVVTALSGYLFLCGDDDRPPVRVSFPIAYAFTSAEAAVGTLMALHYRNRTGEGQEVNISAQQVLATLVLNAALYWELEHRLVRRAGQMRPEVISRERQRQIWQCKDGWISFTIYGAGMGTAVNQALVAWMKEKGKADEFLLNIDWSTLDMDKVTPAYITEIENRISGFFLLLTKRELMEESVKRRIMLLPVNSVGEILGDEQLEARGYWQHIVNPQMGGELVCPGPFAKGSLDPIRPGEKAPQIGEHNREVYAGVGLSDSELQNLSKAGVI